MKKTSVSILAMALVIAASGTSAALADVPTPTPSPTPAPAPAPVPAPAPSSGGSDSVLMRRPLDLYNKNGIPTTTTPTPTPGGTPTPGATPSPTPTPDDGLSNQPGDPNVVDPDPATFGYYYWNVGDWQGPKQCGVQSTITRAVECTYRFYDPRKNYAQGTAHVADAYCADQGAKPPNTYQGTGAGCGYHIHETTPGPWEGGFDYQGNPINVQCSSDAKRKRNYECLDSGGKSVAMSYCTEGLDANGTKAQLEDYEYGNYEGCGYQWKMRLSSAWNAYDGYQGTKLYGAGAGMNFYCGQPGDTSGTSGVQGPVLYVNEQAYCARSDGNEADESQCDASSRPADGLRARGSCHHAFHLDGNYNTTQEVCLTEGAKVLTNLTFSEGGGEASCNAQIAHGATCCMERISSDNYNSPQTQVIATDGLKQKAGNGSYYTVYSDDGKEWRAFGVSNLEYNPDSCTITNEDGDVISTLQPWNCQ